MRRRRVPIVEIEVTSRFTAEVTGTGVAPALDRAGCPRAFVYGPPSGRGPAWCIPQQYAADVEAAVTSLGGHAVVRVALGAVA